MNVGVSGAVVVKSMARLIVPVALVVADKYTSPFSLKADTGIV